MSRSTYKGGNTSWVVGKYVGGIIGMTQAHDEKIQARLALASLWLSYLAKLKTLQVYHKLGSIGCSMYIFMYGINIYIKPR